MKLTETHTLFIRAAFQEMSTKTDLLMLLNYAKKVLFGEKALPFELKHLNYHSLHFTNRYSYFEIKKKSGGVRGIHAPNKGLKQMQKCLNIIFHALYQPNEHVTGFVTGKSVVDNANKHLGMHYVYNIDLKDFFPSIEEKRIFACLKLSPFKLKGAPKEFLAHIIARICCHMSEGDGPTNQMVRKYLPQGAPTSPVLTNIVCQKLDRQLSSLARYHGLVYSRYADDITFSSLHNVFSEDHKFISKLRSLIINQGFTINESKVRLQKSDARQEVTGLTVNEKANVQKRYIMQLRSWLYKWERYGYVRADSFFQKDYIKDQAHNLELMEKTSSAMENVISGKLQYLKMVKSEQDELYGKLYARFSRLITLNANQMKPKDYMDDVLEGIYIDGFEKAMDIYMSKLTENDEEQRTP